MTKAEVLLWLQLKSRKMLGQRFLRQYGIDAYVVDFYCPKLKLAIEVDGESHDRETAREYDSDREQSIRQLGINVLRFRNHEVLDDLNEVVRRIEDAAKTFPLTKGEIQRGSELDKGK